MQGIFAEITVFSEQFRGEFKHLLVGNTVKLCKNSGQQFKRELIIIENNKLLQHSYMTRKKTEKK